MVGPSVVILRFFSLKKQWGICLLPGPKKKKEKKREKNSFYFLICEVKFNILNVGFFGPKHLAIGKGNIFSHLYVHSRGLCLPVCERCVLEFLYFIIFNTFGA